MRILHFVQSLPSAAGITVFVQEIAKAQIRAGHDVMVVTAEDDLDGIDFVPDIAHLHALWNPCNVRFMRWCRKKGYQYVVSVHGCLLPRVFAKSPLKKWLFYWLFLRSNIKKSSAIHCTSEYEKKVCENLGFTGPFVVAPLGIEMPKEVECKKNTNLRTVLFVGRLGEEKGLINLLNAWKRLPRDGWRLVLAGPDWLGYKKLLDEKIVKDGIDGVVFTGAVYGEEKDSLYRSADVFVLPSPMENFSMVVLEALAYGLPTIATKGTPWSELETCKCGWWIDQGVEALRAALHKAMSLSDDDRSRFGANGKALAKSKYSWSSIAKIFEETYGV